MGQLSANTRILILAGGKGKRMKQHLPKGLISFKGFPLISHILDAVDAAKIDPHPAILVSSENSKLFQETLGPSYEYIIQHEQLGTGHAVEVAGAVLKGRAKTLMVFYSDQPFLKTASIKNLYKEHQKQNAVLTMATVTVPDFEGWRSSLADFGRVIRNEKGAIVDIIEKRDATPEIVAIKEVNPSYFCFNTEWLWSNIGKIKNNNAQQEYYLTDLVRIAIEGGERIASLDISPLESMGVNTPEQLELATRL